MNERRLELKAELARHGLRYRDLADQLRECGLELGEFDIARIIAGRWVPPAAVKQAIAAILGRPTYELF